MSTRSSAGAPWPPLRHLSASLHPKALGSAGPEGPLSGPWTDENCSPGSLGSTGLPEGYVRPRLRLAVVGSWTGFQRVGGFCSMTYFLPSPGRENYSLYILSSSSLESSVSVKANPAPSQSQGPGPGPGTEAMSSEHGRRRSAGSHGRLPGSLCAGPGHTQPAAHHVCAGCRKAVYGSICLYLNELTSHHHNRI